MNNLVRRVAPVLVLCLAALGGARAQGGTAPQAAASVPLQYRSAFSDYKPWQDAKPGDWRALNDAVKGDSMTGMDMSGMKGMGDMQAMPEMHDMPGMDAHKRPMPAASAARRGGHQHPSTNSASMPDMPGMPAVKKGGHQ